MLFSFCSDFNKDWTRKDKDKHKDQAYKDQDKDKDLNCKDKDLTHKDKDQDKDFTFSAYKDLQGLYFLQLISTCSSTYNQSQ